MGFILSSLMGGLVYYILCLIWPCQILPGDMDKEGKPTFEMLAANEGFFAYEDVTTITSIRIEGEAADEDGSEGSVTREGYVVETKDVKAMV